MMRVLALWFGLALATMAVAADDDTQNPAITGTIQSQIDAFLADDFEGAFAFASPNIRSLFGNSDRFGVMVRQGYPMVWRPGEVRYLELRDVGGRLLQKVFIRDQAGQVHILDYQMIETEAGWRINGVQLLPAPGVGA